MKRAELKKQARDAMRQARPRPLWVTLVLCVILIILSVLSMAVDGSWEQLSAMSEAAAQGEDALNELMEASVQSSGEGTGLFAWLLGVALEVMSIEMSVGFLLYCLRLWRRQEASVGDMFDVFGMFFRAFWIRLLPSLLLSLWSLVYVIPVTLLVMLTGSVWPVVAGLPLLIPEIVASYAYRQATFIMFDKPFISCMQCVMLSRKLMRGHKWELFKLDLSFLGWYILCVVPVVGLWVLPYVNITCAGYYERLAKGFEGFETYGEDEFLTPPKF